LISALGHLSFRETFIQRDVWGRLVEAAVEVKQSLPASGKVATVDD
jgi:hypothetical protein